MIDPPERDVVKVEEQRGARGARLWILHLSCGCLVTRSGRLPPPKTARCTPCAVFGDPPDVMHVMHVVEVVVDAALGEVARQQGGIAHPIGAEARHHALALGRTLLLRQDRSAIEGSR